MLWLIFNIFQTNLLKWCKIYEKKIEKLPLGKEMVAQMLFIRISVFQRKLQVILEEVKETILDFLQGTVRFL